MLRCPHCTNTLLITVYFTWPTWCRTCCRLEIMHAYFKMGNFISQWLLFNPFPSREFLVSVQFLRPWRVLKTYKLIRNIQLENFAYKFGVQAGLVLFCRQFGITFSRTYDIMRAGNGLKTTGVFFKTCFKCLCRLLKCSSYCESSQTAEFWTKKRWFAFERGRTFNQCGKRVCVCVCVCVCWCDVCRSWQLKIRWPLHCYADGLEINILKCTWTHHCCHGSFAFLSLATYDQMLNLQLGKYSIIIWTESHQPKADLTSESATCMD